MSEKTQLQVSDFDVLILHKLGQYYLTGKMIYELLPIFNSLCEKNINNPAALQNRLRKLYNHGFINRDQRLSRGFGSSEYYYFLTKKGANFFEDLEELKPARGILKRLELGSQKHAFMISEFMVKLEKDVYESRGEATITGFIRENCFDIHVPAFENERRLLDYKPDGTIFLKYIDQDILLFLEADLSTETVMSANPRRSSFNRKINVYSAFKNDFHKNEIITLMGDIKGFRVLVVCRSQQRIKSLISLCQQMGKRKMFLFTELKTAGSHNLLFDPIWQLPNGQTLPLLEVS